MSSEFSLYSCELLLISFTVDLLVCLISTKAWPKFAPQARLPPFVFSLNLSNQFHKSTVLGTGILFQLRSLLEFIIHELQQPGSPVPNHLCAGPFLNWRRGTVFRRLAA